MVKDVLRTQRDRARDANAFPHSARELGWISILDVWKVDEIECFADPLLDLALVERLLLAQSHRDILADGERVEQRGELKDISDARAELVEIAPREMRDIESIDFNRSGVGLEEPDDVFDRDGFSGAGISDDDHRLAFDDIECESLEHTLWTEGFIDVDETDHSNRRKGLEEM